MDKKEIIDILDKCNLDRERVEVSLEAAMVLLNIKEKSDKIDLYVSEEYLDELKNDFESYNACGIIKFRSHEIKKEIKKYGYYIQSPEDMLNSDLDKSDILKIKNFINVKNTNSLVLAYLGDAVYELYIREYLLKYNLKVKELQSMAVDYVSARAQSNFLDRMIEDGFLKDEEVEIIKRARNHKSHSSKNSDIITYKKSTGLEALIGYLKLTNDIERIEEIMKYIVGD